MKFQFKEGEWFDIRKLTDWQKQWCLENLDFTNYSKKQFINNFVFKYRYRNSVFASTNDTYIQSDNELTFNDFYWGDEEVPKESIFDSPRWVTSKKNMELSQGLELISGKDYKVVETIIDGDGDKLFKVVNSLGVLRSYHEGHFHKVTPQDLLPEEVEESFDNLVFTQPLVFGASVPLKNLSDEQLMFIVDYFDLEQPSNHKTHFTCLSTTGERYFSSPVDGCRPCYNLSFNDIFKEVK